MTGAGDYRKLSVATRDRRREVDKDSKPDRGDLARLFVPLLPLLAARPNTPQVRFGVTACGCGSLMGPPVADRGAPNTTSEVAGDLVEPSGLASLATQGRVDVLASTHSEAPSSGSSSERGCMAIRLIELCDYGGLCYGARANQEQVGRSCDVSFGPRGRRTAGPERVGSLHASVTGAET